MDYFSTKLSLMYRVNVNHWQNVQIPIYSACMDNREYLGSFQNKLVSSSFKWLPKYILFLAKQRREGRPFCNGKAYPMNYRGVILCNCNLITCGSNFNCYISVHHPIPTPENREHPDNFQNKSVSSAFCWLSRYILFLAKPKRARREATL